MSISNGELVDISERAMQFASRSCYLEMKRGLAALATIASTAPFVGLFGTVLGLFHAFRGYIGDRTAVFLAVTSGVEEALWTTALGLLVAVPAVWSYNYFAERMERFRIEMENASREVANYLLYRRPRHDEPRR